jgi:hypothetical protein
MSAKVQKHRAAPASGGPDTGMPASACAKSPPASLAAQAIGGALDHAGDAGRSGSAPGFHSWSGSMIRSRRDRDCRPPRVALPVGWDVRSIHAPENLYVDHPAFGPGGAWEDLLFWL